MWLLVPGTCRVLGIHALCAQRYGSDWLNLPHRHEGLARSATSMRRIHGRPLGSPSPFFLSITAAIDLPNLAASHVPTNQITAEVRGRHTLGTAWITPIAQLPSVLSPDLGGGLHPDSRGFACLHARRFPAQRFRPLSWRRRTGKLAASGKRIRAAQKFRNTFCFRIGPQSHQTKAPTNGVATTSVLQQPACLGIGAIPRADFKYTLRATRPAVLGFFIPVLASPI
jgi:hypothetical protein